jgi:hypothetical protein
VQAYDDGIMLGRVRRVARRLIDAEGEIAVVGGAKDGNGVDGGVSSGGDQ